MTIELTAFRWVPSFAQGYVKDLRVRWSLEEAGMPYEAVLIDPTVQMSEAYREWQPFGQVPAYRDGDVEMFESGAIVLHLAAKSEVLAPRTPAGRARVTTCVLAALNSIEPHAQNVIQLGRMGLTDNRRLQVEAKLRKQLEALAVWLGDKEYLEGRFTAGDLVMATVLRELVESGALSPFQSSTPTGSVARRARPSAGPWPPR